MRVVFLGSKPLGFNALTRLHRIAPDSISGIITIDDRSDIRSALGDFEAFARAQEVPFHVARVRKDAAQTLLAWKPDCCFVLGWYWLLERDVLQAVPRGFLGVHNSLLPRYRGFSPLVWSMINGEEEVGYSVFSMTEGMDDGPVWVQRALKVGPEEHVGEVLHRLEADLMETLEDLYPKILEGSARPQPQPGDVPPTYCAQRVESDGQIDWRWPAVQVFNFIRAQSDPYPGAFTFDGGEKVRMLRARLHGPTYYGRPGQVARVEPSGVQVICGDNKAVVLEEVERGGKRGAAAQFLRSISIRLGHP